MEKVNHEYRIHCNSAILSLYEEGVDSTVFHSELTYAPDSKPVVMALLGADRRIEFRHNTTEKPKQTKSLKNGRMFRLTPEETRDWKLRFPQEEECSEPTIVLTFWDDREARRYRSQDSGPTAHATSVQVEQEAFHYSQESDESEDEDPDFASEQSDQQQVARESALSSDSGKNVNLCEQEGTNERAALGRNFTTFSCGGEVLIAMLDSGSEVSLITDVAARRIQANTKGEFHLKKLDVPLRCIGVGNKETNAEHEISLRIYKGTFQNTFKFVVLSEKIVWRLPDFD